MTEVFAWLALLILLVLIELATMGLTTIWFAAGALVATIAAACGAPVLVQVILFLVVSVLMQDATIAIARIKIMSITSPPIIITLISAVLPHVVSSLAAVCYRFFCFDLVRDNDQFHAVDLFYNDDGTLFNRPLSFLRSR